MTHGKSPLPTLSVPSVSVGGGPISVTPPAHLLVDRVAVWKLA